MLILKVNLILVAISVFSAVKCQEDSYPTDSNSLGKYVITPVTEPVEHGEEPHWDPEQESLYFVDITSSDVLRYTPATDIVTRLHISDSLAVSPVIPVRNNPDHLIVGVDRTVMLIKWTGTSNCTYAKKNLDTLEVVQNNYPQNRFNDGKADKDGRLWIGTIGREDADGVVPHTAEFYRMTGANLKNVDVAIPNVTNSNGLCWNKENNILFYIDTATRKISKFDYDADRGQISNRRVAFDLAEYDALDGALPDGMTIDENDNLWVALYHGNAIIHVDTKTGKLIKRIEMPSRDVTSAMFGGKNLDILYVTTSRRDLTPDQRRIQPVAGSVFAITNLGVRGYAPPYTVSFSSQ